MSCIGILIVKSFGNDVNIMHCHSWSHDTHGACVIAPRDSESGCVKSLRLYDTCRTTHASQIALCISSGKIQFAYIVGNVAWRWRFRRHDICDIHTPHDAQHVTIWRKMTSFNFVMSVTPTCCFHFQRRSNSASQNTSRVTSSGSWYMFYEFLHVQKAQQLQIDTYTIQ